jgi:hypothetical protein
MDTKAQTVVPRDGCAPALQLLIVSTQSIEQPVNDPLDAKNIRHPYDFTFVSFVSLVVTDASILHNFSYPLTPIRSSKAVWN